MEYLHDHQVDEINDELEIKFNAELNEYYIGAPFKDPVEKFPRVNSCRARSHCNIHFQSGAYDTAGINGITLEALLVVMEHWLMKVLTVDPQTDCQEYRQARQHITSALMQLCRRGHRIAKENKSAKNAADETQNEEHTNDNDNS
jgi:hypothetical protein